MVYSRPLRHKKKVNPSTLILAPIALVALIAFYIFGAQVNNILTAAILSLLAVGTVLTCVLSWFVYRGLTLRRQRQEAVAIENIDSMSWSEFELFVVKLLKSQGFIIKQHSSSPGDQGADVIAMKGRDCS